MSVPAPPQLQAALAQLSSALEKVEGRKVDVVTESWAAIEKGVIKLLGGPFDPRLGEHQVVALGLAAALGERLAKDHGAFWFPNRETPEGAALGFSAAVITLAPFGAVVDALMSAKLEKLDELVKEIRTTLGQAKFAPGAGGGARLGPEDYMRLFDPGFVQLVAMDPKKAKQAFDTAPERLAHDLRDGISRAGKLPAEVQKQLESQLVGALTRMPAGKPLISSVKLAPRVCETMALLFGGTAASGAAPEELWAQIVFPLLFIGAPASFPPLEAEELDAAKQGIDPLFLYLDVVPYTFKAIEEGMFGAFPADSIGLLDEGMKNVPVRLVKVDAAALKPALDAFSAAKVKDAIDRFGKHVREKTGDVKVLNANEAKQMLEAGIILLEDLKKIVAAGGDVCVRNLTEAEAASEPALAVLRQSLQGPRIILAT